MAGYVLYARKSTESEDRQVLSIDSQVHELKLIAARQGVTVSEVLSESRSAKAPGRPVFGELMRRVERGQVTGLLSWKMDRLARNHLDTGRVLQALADGKLERVITVDRTYTRDGNDRFIGNFELGMATKYIDDLRQNVTRGIRARLERGWVCHNPALGYRIEAGTKRIVKDPERFDLVRRMWDLLLTGTVRPHEICRIANHEWGFRTRQYKRMGGRPLAHSTLYGILANPFYMGLIRLVDGRTYVGAHPPMVSREEFDRAQEILGRPGRERPQRHRFPFTGLIRCAGCGATVTAEQHVKPSGRMFVYYHCSRQKAGVRCREPAVPGPALELQIALFLRRLSMPEPVLAWLQRRTAATLAGEQTRREQVRATLRQTRDGLKREEENLLSLRLRDLVDDATFLEKKRAFQARLAAMDERLAGAGRSAKELAEVVARTFDFAARAQEVFASGTPVQRRMIFEAVCSNPTLRARKLALEFKNPFRMLANAGSCSNWSGCPEDVRTWIEDRAEYFRLPAFDVPVPGAAMQPVA